MSKFHINKHGVPAPCRAEKGKCPYGGESGNENHFDTLEEAQSYADKVNAATHGYLPGMNQSPQAVFQEIYEENDDFIGITSQPEDFGNNEQVRQEFVNKFGDDATIIEANDNNKDPLKYSLDSNYDGLVGPYENLKSTMTEEQRSRFLDENEEFTPEIREVMSDYLKSKEGPEKEVFGMKFKSIENSYDGAKFLNEYINSQSNSARVAFDEIYEENGGFIGTTSQPEDFGDNEQVRQEFVNNFGDDATIIEANDSNKDPLKYSLDSNYDGLVGPYENLKSTMTEEQRSRFLDENEEFTPEIRKVMSDYLKSKEGPEKRVFGKKFKSIENAYDGAEFLRNYINNN